MSVSDRSALGPEGEWPDLFVNLDGRSVADSVRRWFEDILRQRCGGTTVTIVTGYVSIRGLLLFVPQFRALLNAGVRIRLMFGVSPPETAWIARPSPDLRPEPAEMRRLLKQVDGYLRAELSLIPAGQSRSLDLLELLHLLEREEFEVRWYGREFLHSKLMTASGPVARSKAVLGSANLTLGGCQRNQEAAAELDHRRSEQSDRLAERWWRSAEPFPLDSLIQERYLDWPHELIYLKILQAVYGGQVDARAALPLKDWQKDGVANALSKIERVGGALVADDVGIGKTYEAGEIIRYGRDAGWGPALVVCPARLRRMWKQKLNRWELSAAVISYERLRGRAGEEDFAWDSYGLVVCDEAHWLRNPARKTAIAFREMLGRQAKRPRIVLLTATPVNNYGADLYELLTLVDSTLEHSWAPDSVHSRRRTRGRGQRGTELLDLCEHADALASNGLQRLHLLLDQLIVRRTRQFIATEYPGSDHRFPEQHPEPVRYRLSPPMRRLLAAFLDAMGISGTDLADEQTAELVRLRGAGQEGRRLTFAAYELAAYARRSGEIPKEALSALTRIQLCKRIESSPVAFERTVARMACRTRQTLDDLNQGFVRLPADMARYLEGIARDALWEVGSSPEYGTDADETDEDEDETRSLDETTAVRISDRDILVRLRANLEHDLSILASLTTAAHTVLEQDTKFGTLVECLARLAHDPSGRKVLILAGARDTTADLTRRLETRIASDPRLAPYRGRWASLGGEQRPESGEVTRVVAEFSPPEENGDPDEGGGWTIHDRYDLLIGTDMLAEGLNMPKARHLINYDLAWNPQVLGQRAGRLDRYGSPHDHITCYTFFPDEGLDLVLRLIDRLLRKAALAAATVGTAQALFPGAPIQPRNFVTDQGKENNARRATAFIADKHRAWLAQALRTPQIAQLLATMPGVAGGVASVRRGHPGMVFCFEVAGSGGRVVELRRVLTGDRNGATLRDQLGCLKEVHVPLSGWLKQVKRGMDPVGHPDLIPDAVMADFHNLVNRARNSVAEEHGIPAEEAAEHVKVIAWLALRTG